MHARSIRSGISAAFIPLLFLTFPPAGFPLAASSPVLQNFETASLFDSSFVKYRQEQYVIFRFLINDLAHAISKPEKKDTLTNIYIKKYCEIIQQMRLASVQARGLCRLLDCFDTTLSSRFPCNFYPDELDCGYPVYDRSPVGQLFAVRTLFLEEAARFETYAGIIEESEKSRSLSPTFGFLAIQKQVKENSVVFAKAYQSIHNSLFFMEMFIELLRKAMQ